MSHYPMIDEGKSSCSGLTSEHGISANGASEALAQLAAFEKEALKPCFWLASWRQSRK